MVFIYSINSFSNTNTLLHIQMVNGRLIFIGIFTLFFYTNLFSQNDFDRILKSSEIILNGLSFLKKDKTEVKTSANTKVIESVCVKNIMNEKITFKLEGKDEDDNSVKKELVIPKDGKECCLELPKGIYTYEIILANKEVFKKGEYRFTEELTITVKPD